MRKIRLLLALVLISQVFACGLSNTMYNARKYFKTAVERPLNSNGKPTPQAVDEYTKAIKKCGIIITERKNGKQLEEALFIMAKALYLKGNSSFQAKDQFDNLIRLNPESKYIPEAVIFQARVLRDINKPAEADALLEGFIRDPRYRKYHPRALLTLADFEILDKDYYRAQFWLEKIITEYPKTTEFRDAYFLFGKNYYVQEDYASSLEEFTKLSRIRRIDKNLRLDAFYYIGLNQYELGDYAEGLKAVNTVIRSELRPEKLAQARVLKGNLLIKSGKEDSGKAELEAVLKDYPRTQASASAAYGLGEYYFYYKQDKINALANYTRVRTEYPTGELVAMAQAKNTAITQLNSTNILNSETKLQEFLDYHYLAAENYFEQLDLPDSSFVVYRRLISEGQRLKALSDSLMTRQTNVQATLDSLDLALATFVVNDSIGIDSTLTIPVEQLLTETDTDSTIVDSTMTVTIDPPLTETAQDSTIVVSTRIVTIDPPLSEIVRDSTAVDSTFVEDKVSTEKADLERRKAELETEKQALTQRLETLQPILSRFDREVIPFVYFCMANIHGKLGNKDPEIADILAYMREDYPENKYTNAIRMLYADENVRIIDPAEERLERDLDYALGLYPEQADSMRVILEQISAQGTPAMQLKANFRLGWFYAIDRADTTSARAYFDAVLKESNSGEYGTLARKLFDGSKFLIYNDPPPVDSTAVIPDSLTTLDSLYIETTSDSLSVSDSLFIETVSDSLSVPDSLGVTPEGTATPETETPQPDLIDPLPEPGTVPPIDKEEDLPLTPGDQPPNPQDDTPLE